MDLKFDPYAERNRVIRQRNIALGLVLTFFVVLFFAITVVKMHHMKMPHKVQPAGTMGQATGGMNGH
jgi:hypothetical protein